MSAPFSRIGLGCGGLGDASMPDADAERLVHAAIDLGVTVLDAARSYGCAEERLGRALGTRRKDVVLSTKGGYGVDGAADWTYEAVRRGVEEALGRLRTDWIDVFCLHSCPREVLERGDVVRALEDARAAGKVRLAAYSGENDALDWALASHRLDALECSVNLFDQQSMARVLPDACARGVPVLAKRPLANCAWRFAERPHGHYAESYWLRMRAMDLDAADWLETAIRFSAWTPGVSSALVGTTRLEHLRAVLAAVARGPLPEEVYARVRAAFLARGAAWGGEI